MATEATAVPQIAVPSLRRSFGWVMAGNVVYAGCQWGMISVLAKLGNTEVVGQFALGLAITAPIFMLTGLQLRGVQATDARSEYEFGHYFTLRLASSFCGLLVIAGMLAASGYDRVTSAVVLLIGVAKAIESLSDVVAGLLQKHERLDQVSMGLMMKGALSVVAFAVVYRATHSLIAATAVMAVSWALVAVFWDLRLALRLEGSVRRFFVGDRRRIAHLALLSAPLGLVMGMISLNANIPRYMIEHHLGRGQLGIFAAMAYLMVAAGLVINALGQSASARLSRMFACGELDKFKSLLGKLALFGLALGVVGLPLGYLLGRPVLTLLYAPEYADHMGAFLIMVGTLGITGAASFLGYGMTAARRFRPQVPLIAACAVTTLLLSLVLVPKWGLTGAAVALLASALVLLTGSALIVTGALRARQRAL